MKRVDGLRKFGMESNIVRLGREINESEIQIWQTG